MDEGQTGPLGLASHRNVGRAGQSEKGKGTIASLSVHDAPWPRIRSGAFAFLARSLPHATSTKIIFCANSQDSHSLTRCIREKAKGGFTHALKITLSHLGNSRGTLEIVARGVGSNCLALSGEAKTPKHLKAMNSITKALLYRM